MDFVLDKKWVAESFGGLFVSKYICFIMNDNKES